MGLVGLSLGLFWTSSLAQQPTLPAGMTREQALQLLQQRPDLVRQRIRESGLSAEEIRGRLAEAGLSSTLLDPFLQDSLPAGATVSTEMIQAMEALGVAPAAPQGVETLPLATGGERTPAAQAAGAGGLQLFGLDVFRGRTTQFQPLLAGPVPDTYRVGPGDAMVLVVTGDVELVHQLQVTREGFIVIPQVGQLFVNGLTMAQLREVLRERLGRSYSGIRRGSTHFDVSISRLRTIQAFVIGEVAQPGAYQLASVATVLNGLYAAGGPTERGSFREVRVQRGGRVVTTLDLYEYLLSGSTENDVVLEQGDVVFVPVQGKLVRVAGAVLRPAIYEAKPGETLKEVIQAAGGFRPDAALERISVSRIVPPSGRVSDSPDRIVVDVPLRAAEGAGVPRFPLEPGDQITIFSLGDGQRSVVELRGNVYLPGTYGWYRGMQLSDLIRLGGGFRPAVYAGGAHVERLDPVDSTRFVFRVPLPPDSGAPYPDDLLIEDYDLVTIYGREEFRDDRMVTISGMVHRAGAYPYRNDMTLRDLILMARGLSDGAYLDSLEVARLPADRSRGQLAVRFRVPMDSTYLFERDSTTYRFIPGPPVANGTAAPEFTLAPFDHVTILRQPGFDLQRTVHITGELRFPGTYALERKDERLSDLVKRAGGLLPSAYPDGARFNRSLEGAGRVNVDLRTALARPGRPNDLVLQPGDSVHVPEYMPIVRVVGGVNSPTSVRYERGQGLNYYVSNAGGYASNADKGRVSVRYADGSARIRSRFLLFTWSPEPGPGSTIVVPLKPTDQRGIDLAVLFGGIAQILSAVTTMILVVDRLATP